MSTQKTIGLSAHQAEGLTNVDPFLLAEGFSLIAAEKQAQFRPAFRQHWKALFWSMSLSIALIMDGESSRSRVYPDIPQATMGPYRTPTLACRHFSRTLGTMSSSTAR